MKKLLFISVICLLLTSCSQSLYYQVYQTKPMTDNIKVNADALVYEDNNCIILYDFWREKGDVGFVIYNKNEENLYIHLDECFYVENGFAYDYYKNKINNLFVVGSITEVEKSIICIPPLYSKKISEFNINEQLYKDCDLPLYPGKNENNILRFTEEDSPFVFGNIIAYSIGDSTTIHRINHSFYVSKISNYPVDMITIEVPKEECGKKIPYKTEQVFKNSGPDQFYIQYNYDYRYDNKPDNPLYYGRY